MSPLGLKGVGMGGYTPSRGRDSLTFTYDLLNTTTNEDEELNHV
jgi:hypothetical protein